MSVELVEAKVLSIVPNAAAEHDDVDPPQYPASEASSSCSRPPPFSSLFATVAASSSGLLASSSKPAAPAYDDDSHEDVVFDPDQGSDRAYLDHVAETKRALPSDTKGESSRNEDDTEPPPAYSEGSSPLDSFTYVMAAAGGAASLITQVQQTGLPINALSGTPLRNRGGLRSHANRSRCWCR